MATNIGTAGIQDLENQNAGNQQLLAQRVNAGAPPGTPPQQGPPSPIPPGGVRGLLTRFFQGMGASMMNSGGALDAYNKVAEAQYKKAATTQAQAATVQTQVATQGQALQNAFTARRLQMIDGLQSGTLGNDIIAPLGNLSSDEQAIMGAARAQAAMSGSFEPIYQGSTKIAQMRQAKNLIGSGSNVTIDTNPDSPTFGQPVKQFFTKGGQVATQVPTTPTANLANNENNWIARAQQGDPVAQKNLDTLMTLNTKLAAVRGAAFAQSRADNWPFETFDANGNLTTTTVRQAITQGLPSAQVWNSMFGPTGSTKSQGQAAGAVQQHIPDAIKAIDNLASKGQLGAIAGRINEWETKGYGGNDPDIAELVTTVGLLDSGAVRAHFGARGGAQILDKFHGLLNMAQEPNAMKGSLNAINSFLSTYKSVGTAAPPRTNLNAPNTQGGQQSVIEQHSPSTNQYRYSMDGGKTWQAGRAPRR